MAGSVIVVFDILPPSRKRTTQELDDERLEQVLEDERLFDLKSPDTVAVVECYEKLFADNAAGPAGAALKLPTSAGPSTRSARGRACRSG